MSKKKEHKRKGYFSLLLFLIISLFPFLVQAKSAYFYFAPSKGVYEVGKDLLLDVRFNTGGRTINAAEVVINFNPTKLKVAEIIKQNSVFDSWLPESGFYNNEGKIILRAGLPKGVLSTDSRFALIRFKIVGQGRTTVYFKSGALLEANGQATNILDELKPASFIFEPKNSIPSSLKGQLLNKFSNGPPFAPTIFSYTHPDEDLWFSNNSPELRWEIGTDITAVSFSVDKIPINEPEKIYEPPVKEAKFDKLEDGIWYFHLRLKNKHGWGETINRRIMIDTISPQNFEIKIKNNSDLTNPSPLISFKANDSLSGIDYYKIKIDNEPLIRLEKDEYIPKPLKPGYHTVVVMAYDRAGNSAINLKEFQIKPLKSPEIVGFLPKITVGNPLVIKGKTDYPNSTINIFLNDGTKIKKLSTQTDSLGNWFFAYEKGLSRGVYQVSVQVEDKRGAISLPTKEKIVLVTYPVLIRVGKVAISYLTVFLSLIGLIIILILIVFYAWYRTNLWKRKLSLETKEMYTKVAKAFSLLDKELKSQIEYLDSKPGFSEEEELIYHRLKMVVKHAENIVGEEIKDLKKDLGIE